jgi:Icc-related predicted phosphoesterase
MKLHILSDIHLERWKFQYSQPDCDVVVLAGDIGPGFQGIEWINTTMTNDVPVVYVPGNHEYYGEPFWEHQKRLEFRAKECDVQLLNNRSFVHNGVRFIGSTLWTDYNLYGNQPTSMIQAEGIMSDFKAIDREDDEMFSGQIKAYDLLSEHQYSLKYIISELEKPFDGKTVVVTHHAPSELSVAEHYRGTKHPPFYASRLENVMLDHAPALWIHGHIHDTSDYMIGETRVIANPRGSNVYPNKTFNPSFVIEI